MAYTTPPSPTGEAASIDCPEKALEAGSRMHSIRDGHSQSGLDARASFSDNDYIIVRWAPGEAENPYNWSNRRKTFLCTVGILQVINSTLGSSIPSGAVAEISKHFDVTNSQQLTLLISTYLIGYVVGPMVFGPLSETFGRRWVMIPSFFCFVIFTMACAVAPSFAALCIFRLLCGIAASSPIVVIGGLIADIYADLESRGKAMAIFMVSTCWGPTVAPIISGFIGNVGWQWPFWVAFFFGVLIFPVICTLPETYGPILLRTKARRLRKENPNKTYVSKLELEPLEVRHIVTRVLYRPLSMIIHEGIVSFSCVYLSLVYSVFYMFFPAFNIVFEDMYGLSAGITGIAFLPVSVGCFIAYIIFRFWDAYLRRAARAQKPWALQDEYQRLPLAFLGGPAVSIGIFWLAWTAWPQVHPVVPMLAGIPFGIGFLLIFMALINYLTDAYETYAASALAATSIARSIFGAVLPLATEPMYGRLGIHWATSLLGFASVVMIAIPLAFIRIGPYLRQHSKFSLELKEIKAREEEEERRAANEGQPFGLSRTGSQSQDLRDVEKQVAAQLKDKALEAGPSKSEEQAQKLEREKLACLEKIRSRQSEKAKEKAGAPSVASSSNSSDNGEMHAEHRSSLSNEKFVEAYTHID